MTGTELRDLQTALERLYVGEQSVESRALADALEDLGYVGLRAARVTGQQELPDPASTRGLPKRRAS